MITITTIAGLLSVVILFFVINPPSPAYSMGYVEQSYFMMKKNPTICVIKPSDAKIQSADKIVQEAISSVKNWQIKLEDYTHNKNWNLKTVVLDSEQENSSCNVSIDFKRAGSGPQGKTWLDNGQTKIEVYTSKYNEYWIRTGTDFNNNPISMMHSEDDPVPIERLGITIRHELGHALGLGHYKTQDQMETWESWYYNTPSIMIEENVDYMPHAKITELDITSVISKYGINGFQ